MQGVPLLVELSGVPTTAPKLPVRLDKITCPAGGSVQPLTEASSLTPVK